jgi:GNAT superfamily N-acetyltransferase
MEANYRAFWETLAASPLMQIEQRPQGMRFVSGVKNPVFNGIMSPRLPADDAAVEAELDYFKSRSLPMSWTLGPNDTPADLGERLERLGLPQTSTNPGMIVDLSELREEDATPGLEVQQIEDEASFRTFNRVLCDGFGLPEAPEFAEMFIAAGTGQAAEIASFLGMLDGEPVGTSRTVLRDGLAGVYVVTTADSARGKGIGRAMTLAACLYGKERGYKLGTLQASDMGHPVYLRMGFRDVCEFRDFTWTGH